MGKRFYIDVLGIKYEETPQGVHEGCPKRQERWDKEREKYGFDYRETWCLSYTMNLFLYERLCMYLRIADEYVDLRLTKYEYNGEILTLEKCIGRMIYGLKLELTLKDDDEKRRMPEYRKFINDVYPLYDLCKYDLYW